MSSSGSAKESGSVSESSSSAGSSYGMSSSDDSGSSNSSGAGSSSDELLESSSESVYVVPGDESSSSSSSSCSCQCDFEVSGITLTSATTGFYTVTNTGCGEVVVIGHGGNDPHMRAVPFPLGEGESMTVTIEASQDIRLTSFEVLTDCKTIYCYWPDF